MVCVTVRMLMIPSFLIHLNVAYLKMDWERENKLKLSTDKMEVLTIRGKNEFGTEVKFAQIWVAFSQNTIAIMPNVTTWQKLSTVSCTFFSLSLPKQKTCPR